MMDEFLGYNGPMVFIEDCLKDNKFDKDELLSERGDEPQN